MFYRRTGYFSRQIQFVIINDILAKINKHIIHGLTELAEVVTIEPGHFFRGVMGVIYVYREL